MSAFEYPHAAERREAPTHQQYGKRNRILIVEDNPISLTLLKQLLRAHGYEVLGTPEGLQALDLAREEQPDLILMDIRLPDISGFEVTRLLKQDQRTKTKRTLAASSPFRPSTTSTTTACPSSRILMPDRSSAETWTNTSLPPLS